MIPSLQRTWRRPVDGLMRWLFTGSATLTIVAFGVIIFLLFRESFNFFPEYRKSLIQYRSSGMEYVDLLESRYREFIEIDQALIELRAKQIRHLRRQGLSGIALSETLSGSREARLFANFRRSADPLRDYITAKRRIAIEQRNQLLKEPLPVALVTSNLRGDLEVYRQLLNELQAETEALFAAQSDTTTFPPALASKIQHLAGVNRAFHADNEQHLNQLRDWHPDRPVDQDDSLKAFFLGDRWITSSDQQNWYGLLPLLTGSLFVAGIALVIAVPIGLGAAVYVNLLAGTREQAFLKPSIEFIAALPAVVVGFFGVMVYGEIIQMLARGGLFDGWLIPEVRERLNAFAAGSLLALMAIPTIFTLAEDALFAVRREIKDASFAMGATRLQTAFRVVVPSALPGLVSAVLLGFGRVIGETMIVLLCAGNRAVIPDFSSGLAVIFDPVHTMTGMIAQEMGEVVSGNLHYRALFMVGLVLFVLSLFINYGAQSLVERHRQNQTRGRP